MLKYIFIHKVYIWQQQYMGNICINTQKVGMIALQEHREILHLQIL